MVKIDFWLVQHKENAVFQNPVMGSHGLTSQVYAVLEGKKNIYIYTPVTKTLRWSSSKPKKTLLFSKSDGSTGNFLTWNILKPSLLSSFFFHQMYTVFWAEMDLHQNTKSAYSSQDRYTYPSNARLREPLQKDKPEGIPTDSYSSSRYF